MEVILVLDRLISRVVVAVIDVRKKKLSTRKFELYNRSAKRE